MIWGAIKSLGRQVDNLVDAVQENQRTDEYLKMHSEYGDDRTKIEEASSQPSTDDSRGGDPPSSNYQHPNALIPVKSVEGMLQHMPCYLVEQNEPGVYSLPIPAKRWTEHEIYIENLKAGGYLMNN